MSPRGSLNAPPGNALATVAGGAPGAHVQGLPFDGHEAETLFPGGYPYDVISVTPMPAGHLDIVLRDAR